MTPTPTDQSKKKANESPITNNKPTGYKELIAPAPLLPQINQYKRKKENTETTPSTSQQKPQTLLAENAPSPSKITISERLARIWERIINTLFGGFGYEDPDRGPYSPKNLSR